MSSVEGNLAGGAPGSGLPRPGNRADEENQIAELDQTADNSAATSVDEDSQPAPGGVDVEKAKKEWNELGRELSRQSAAHIAKTASNDVEKAEEEEEFNLRDWLSASQNEASQAGIKNKSLGVSWSDLEVEGAASMNLHVRTLPDAIIGEVLKPLLMIGSIFKWNPFFPGKRKLLQGFTGSARPGEMVLVLGRPGSGCSTFLKTIANQRNGFMAVNGDVSYGGLSSGEIKKHYRGEVVYSEEDDLHHATLTVGRTLDFALRLKSPGKMLPDRTRKTFKKEIRDMMLKMVNIAHTKHTLVGSAYVRGVSGGERKRVSILEALATRATVLSWDNSSRGLDASTALDYAKSMRILTDLLQATMFVSLYQAGEGIWEQFDKVLIIDEGRCVYYGPRDQARNHFISLGFMDRPRQTSADYITGCTDKYERVFQEGRDETNVPSTPEQLEEAYRNSDIYKQVLADKAAFDDETAKDVARREEFQQAVREDKHKGVRQSSQYTVPFLTQVYALWLRQMQMTIGDKFDIFVSYFTAIVIALLVGGIFFQMEQTAAGAFTRGGVLFIGLLFNSLTTFSELPTQMGGRPILYRQNGFAFYRPSALPIAQLFADVPFGLPRVLIFSIILYFMSGLFVSAGAFFTFALIVVVSYYAFRSLFATFGTICRDYNVAARLAAVIIVALVNWAGYVIPRRAMPDWLAWIWYLNPLAYAFEALMINEFKGFDIQCVGSFITPSGPGYPATLGPNQVCTLPGSSPGNPAVPGLDYINASFGYERGHLWRNVGIIFAFFFGLTFITCFVIESMEQGAFSSALTVTKKPSKEEAKLNQRLKDRRDGTGEKEEEVALEVKGQNFTWKNLKYTVPVKGGKRVLLDNVSGFVKPGTLTALMGASGAGKTTLLDVLADRKTIGVIEGDRLVEGKPIGIDFQRSSGYAEQQDIHEPTATVREALRFSAYLRQSRDTPKEEKDRYVEEIIELLELQDLADAMIGWVGFGLGVGDRKRVTIGVELAAKPEMLLFLDEPTSGLDGQAAFTIVRLLKRLADAGQTILCTIHQPSSLLFEQFDRLLLLQRGGQVVYFGPVGKDSKHIIKYFADNGAQCPEGVNMAEAMLDFIGAGSQKRVGPRDWADIYKDSDLYRDNLRQIEEIDAQGLQKPPPEGIRHEYAAPWMVQFKTVLARTLRSSWRQPDYQYTRIFQHFAFALLTSLLFIQLGNNLATMQYRVFAIFVLSIIPAVIMAQIEPFFIMARSVWIREETSKTFSGSIFAITQLIAEVPYAVICATVYFLPFYFIIGFQTSSDRAGYFFAMTFVIELFAITIGQMIASLVKSIYLASLFNPFIIIILSLTCGVVAPVTTMPSGLYSKFFYNVNPIRFVVSAVIANELHELPVECEQAEFAVFQPPQGQSCSAWAGNFISSVGGYLANPDAQSDCNYCQYRVGDDFYTPLGISFNDRGRNIGIVLAFTVFNGIVTVLATKFLRFSNR